jgi:SAM-dependent methyltransferase
MYDDFANKYVTSWAPFESYSAIAKVFLSRTVRENCRVLDAGCGPGHLTCSLPEFVRVTGFDISARMVEAAREARPGGNYFVHSYYDPLPPELGVFDVVLALGALDFCEDLGRVLSHFNACMSSQGALLLNVIERRCGFPGHDRNRLSMTLEDMSTVDLVLYDFKEMALAIETSGLLPINYRFGPGYVSQYHKHMIYYAIWELSKPQIAARLL